jgi:hypothetical protein
MLVMMKINRVAEKPSHVQPPCLDARVTSGILGTISPWCGVSSGWLSSASELGHVSAIMSIVPA